MSALLVLKCPACIPALAALLGSLGLSIMLSQTVLKAFLIMMLLVTMSSLIVSYLKNHKVPYPLFLGTLFSIGLYLGKFYYVSSVTNAYLSYGSLVGLGIAFLWDFKLKNKVRCNACN
jgi:uncharacterized BrkB/YihY/UPF0761 family membrane protein